MLRVLRCWLIVSVFLAVQNLSSVQAAPAVVRAVLFFSPSCSHCHQVMTENLPPLLEKYGKQLQIVEVNVTQPEGQTLFQAAVQHFKLARAGVPTLVIADVVLMGSLEIPERLPGLIEKYLAQGGADWPAIPGLVEALGAQATPEVTDAPAVPAQAASTTPAEVAPQPQPISVLTADNAVDTQPLVVKAWANVVRDPVANGLAIITLLGMLVSVVTVLMPRRSPIVQAASAWHEWSIPALCLIGLVVAGYLAYVEAANVEAVCGPVGDCNTVQQSEYARLFGFLSIGMLGLLGYTAILGAWGIERWGRAPLNRLAALALVLMAFGGTLFSIYLTFLEPFVIGATCAWCLTSAILMTSLMLLIVPRRLALLRGRLR